MLMMGKGGPVSVAMAVAGLIVGHGVSMAGPGTPTVDKVQLGQALVASGETGTVTVATSGLAGGEQVALSLRNRLGLQVHAETKPAAAAVPFTIPGQANEGPLLLTVTLTGADPVERVYSVVDTPANDIRYGFFADYDNPSADFQTIGDILADLHLNAIEYYDYFRGHGDYAPEIVSYTNEPFNAEFIHTGNIDGKGDANRARNIANIAYIAPYSAIPEIGDPVGDFLLNESDEPLVFFNGAVGTEADLGGVWFRLMAFAPDTTWFAFLEDELGRALDDSPADRVQFEGFEVDTYGYQGTYNSVGSSFNGQSVAQVVAEFCGALRDLTQAAVPNGMVATNTIAEEFIETVYDKVDFLFVENWAYHKPRYEDVVEMCLRNKAASGLRLVSKSYPADTPLGSSWPATNLRYLMGAHLAGGGSLMVAGEPNPTTGQIGALNTLYYPTYTLQSAENYGIIRDYNAHDAALYLRNHGATVRPLETDLAVDDTLVTSFRADDGAATWCFLRLAGADQWTSLATAPTVATNAEVTLTLPNRLTPRAVLYGTPDQSDLVYPKPLSFAELGNGTISVELPVLEYFGTLVVEPMPMAFRAEDSAADPAYDTAWDSTSNGGSGWAGGWQLNASGPGAGTFVGTSTGNGTLAPDPDGDINDGGRSWGLFSGLADTMEAVRPFAPLEVDESVGLFIDNGWIATNGVVGFDLRNSAGERLMGFQFIGGEGNYRVVDRAGSRATTIPFTEEGLDVEVTLTSPTEFRIRVVPLGSESLAAEFTGELEEATGGSLIGQLRVFSQNAGVGPPYDFYFNQPAVYRVQANASVDCWKIL